MAKLNISCETMQPATSSLTLARRPTLASAASASAEILLENQGLQIVSAQSDGMVVQERNARGVEFGEGEVEPRTPWDEDHDGSRELVSKREYRYVGQCSLSQHM